ncbi:glycosyltransferase family 4 protein [Pseudalkalibacillus caeni]|uniref:Glycosyltransferase family 1 protein n=1 Tax=Exobacillus caeni TaxID=2574798 RepID=A0A5R9F943_9BACL|nr:glycosyltransferase family 1 protein [Pseudalkalibacillus caeni]TLS39029.1 glycosyltransferase family 1 protein [Pseudalkalibacillus caeni]
MKLALFTDTYLPQVNGVSRTLSRLAAYLDRQQIDYQLFAPDGNDEDLFGSNVYRFASLKFFLYPECRIALPKLGTIQKQLKGFQPDLLHIATPFNIGLSGLHYGKKLDIPMVGSYHTNFDEYLSHYRLEFLSPFIWRYMLWFHQPFHTVFVPSRSTQSHLYEKGFQEVSLWKRGVDCTLFHPQKKSAIIREKYGIKEKNILLFVSRIAPEKNLDTLIKIMERLPQDIKEQTHWIIVGDGPSLPVLKNKVPANVTFLGYLQGEDLAEIYASSDLFVFPSATETFGNVVLEALASGTPVIGARAGGVQEIISHNNSGILCDPWDPEQYVSGIVELLEKKGKRKMMEYNARCYALTQSWDTIFSELINHYELVLYKNRVAQFA